MGWKESEAVLEKWRNRKNRPTAVDRPEGDGRRRSQRARRKARRLAQAGMFAAVRGIAYTLGCAAAAWLIVWLTQR
ncbi:hypothetical protein AB0L25_06765 [Spirillospora sp. NPDC052242]